MIKNLQFEMARIGALLAVILAVVTGCGKKESNHQHANKSHHHTSHSHHHEPPHGGTVIRLGDELYHMEWVKDSEAGIMRCYIMDGHLEQFVRIAQETFEVLVRPTEGQQITWIFNAVENRATGEQVGSTSEFHAQLSELPDQNTFEGYIKNIHILEQRFENISFKFPEGNETH